MNPADSKKIRYIKGEELEEQNEFCEKIAAVLSSKFGDRTPLALVHTYGCQANVSDGEHIKGMLERMGFDFTDDVESADLILYNTCAIREHAEDRVFGNVGALKHKKEENKDAIIALCGCMMQQEHVAEKIKKSYPFVDLVFGTHVIHKFPELLFGVICRGERRIEIPNENGVIAEGIPVHRDSKIKAWLPIMYGCNNFCSYCIVPYVKGRERSRKFDDIIAEAKEIIDLGYKEITLLGQNVNSYGSDLDEDVNFSKLLRSINDLDGDFKIRFMTSHPKDCTHELLDTMASCEKVAKHLHLPLQSGNDRVLKEMNRKYDSKQYFELIQYAKKVMPDISITSDIIVGFPGETYDEFCDTLEMLKKVEYTSLFTFIFSPRKGTKAAKMEDPVSREEKGKWFKELCDLQESIAGKRTAMMKDKIYRVLAEEETKPGSGIISGRTEGNIIIEFPSDIDVLGKYCDVKVTNPRTWIVYGELVK